MNIILYDRGEISQRLLPFTYTRPVSKILVGLLTIQGKWHHYFPNASISFLTQDHLQKKFPLSADSDNWLIHGGLCPSINISDLLVTLGKGNILVSKGKMIAARVGGGQKIERLLSGDWHDFELVEVDNPVIIDAPWKIFKFNADQIKSDFQLVTKGRRSSSLGDAYTKIYGIENVFVESGVSIKSIVINAEGGPVYLGKNTQIQEGALIRGPFGLLEGSTVNMGAKIREGTTIGPYCKVGGEVNNSVLFGYSNKGHEGFLGNSVLGEWCNLGADTNNSNLKNNYSSIKTWDYLTKSFQDTGLQFCGLMMGDHSKCGINTMFNTGTVTGVFANIFGAGFPKKFVPSFTWGGVHSQETYQLEKAFDVAEKVMERRGKTLDEEDKKILSHIFKITEEFRN